ncbi:cyclodeaminase [Brevibacillus humidisoli]|uniref:cyclodeaminase n=1 Tax=Brevibacillus humidisoli TaxID=2895522 RepID=UPI001E59E6A9|nr:cyclodeaminase [Brevibacillus humidisoli]UFJ42241.1 cyclodeaminase [Brevibacillus humidisoli]
MLIFREQEIRQHIDVDPQAIAVVEQGFTSLSNKEATMPPIMRVDVYEHNGEVDVKTAYIKGLEMFCIKISSGFFDNHKRGLPSGNGMMLLVDSQTGIPKAVLLDNGYLTDVRTAAAGAIAAKYMAPQKIETAGVIGAGSQAKWQMRALSNVRRFHNIIVYARSEQRIADFVQSMKRELGVNVIVAKSAEEVVRESNVVVTTTPASSPVIRAEWLHRRLHITAMGSDAEHKQELEPAVLAQADQYVCDSVPQVARLGELHHAIDAGVMQLTDAKIELGDITSGKRTGRENEQQITVCDLTGTGVQDTVIALHAYKTLTKNGLGLEIS